MVSCRQSVDSIKDSAPWFAYSLGKTWFLFDNPLRVSRILRPGCTMWCNLPIQLKISPSVACLAAGCIFLTCFCRNRRSPEKSATVSRILHPGRRIFATINGFSVLGVASSQLSTIFRLGCQEIARKIDDFA